LANTKIGAKKKTLNNKDNMEWGIWWYVVCDMLVCGYVICGMLICWYVICDMWSIDMWYVGMVIGIENMDIFVKFLVKKKNEQKNQ
jgi:hypothetical protein